MSGGGAAAKPEFRILVVEDEGGTALILKHILKREGYTVVHAADGREAAALVGTEPVPLLVLTDLMLPYVGGQELIRLVRGNLSWCEVPIIVLTSRSEEKDAVAVLDAGATDYIRKPFRPEELLARVRRCLRSPG